MHVLTIGTDRKMFEEGSAVAQRTIKYAQKAGSFSVVVFSLQSHNLTQKKISPEVTLYPTNSSNRFMYLIDAIRIAKGVVIKEKFVRGDSVISCQDPFECGFVGWRVARHFRLPLHLQVHTDFLSPYFKTSLLQRLRVLCARFLLPKAQAVRVVSLRIAESIQKAGIRLKKTANVLPIRIAVSDTEVKKIENFFPQFNFKILLASRLEKEKRITDAIDAFKNIHTQFPQAGLLIAGSGSQESLLQKNVQNSGLTDHVVFLGWVDGLSSYIASADVFLSTSEYEGYGMSVVEAGLCGTPVVSTHVGVAGEVLVDGVNSSVCPVGDILCITRKISELIVHNEKRAVFSVALREDIKKIIPSESLYVEKYVEDLSRAITK